jgi:hypothetical protein
LKFTDECRRLGLDDTNVTFSAIADHIKLLQSAQGPLAASEFHVAVETAHLGQARASGYRR